MSSHKQCPRCGETGPVTFHVQGNDRVGLCANQHKMVQEPITAEPFEHRRLSNWLRNLERSASSSALAY